MNQSNSAQATMSISARLLAWLGELSDVRWWWLLLLSLAVQVGNLMLIGLATAFFAVTLTLSVGGTPPPEPISQFSTVLGAVGGPIIQLVLTGFVASWLVRRVPTAFAWHGLLLGVLTGIWGQLVALAFGAPVASLYTPLSLLLYAGHVVIGWIGANRGRAVRAGQERFYRASQAVLHTNQPQAIVNAIGAHLAGPDVTQIGLWEVLELDERRRPLTVSLSAAWMAKGAASWQPGRNITMAEVPTLPALHNEPLLLKGEELAVTETTVWGAPGVRAVLLIPLVAPAGVWEGVLTLTSRASGGFSRNTMRDYETLAGQLTLVLENMRLLEQARETAVLQERQRLAHEIHDTLAQGFTSIVMHLEAAEQALPGDLTITQHHLDQARSTARNSLEQARRVVQDLRPEVLEKAPFDEAVARVVDRWAAQSGIGAEMIQTGTCRPLHPEVEVTLLRVTQEALANIRKHAQAQTAQVTLSYLEDVIMLDVQDDGIGFMPGAAAADTAAAGGYGLVAMRERVQQLGGRLLVESEAGEGTTLVVSIPLGS